MRQIAAVLVALVLAGVTAVPAHADSTVREVGYGAGSALGTILYVPFKTTFCVVGAVTSGLTLPFGGMRTAEGVATAACGGTWVITPDTLKGRDPVRFVGGGSSAQRADAQR
jgi:hypothetical protein